MGQALTSIPNPRGPLMRLKMELRCDGDHGLLEGGHVMIEGDDYIVMRKIASESGWRRCFGGLWLGPCCAGRTVRDEAPDA